MKLDEGYEDVVDLRRELPGRRYDDALDMVTLRGFLTTQEFLPNSGQ
jgi:hypothetical protein